MCGVMCFVSSSLMQFFILRREGGGVDMSHRNNEIDCKNMTILRINFSLGRNWSLVRVGGGGWRTRAPTIPNETLSMHNK